VHEPCGDGTVCLNRALCAACHKKVHAPPAASTEVRAHTQWVLPNSSKEVLPRGERACIVCTHRTATIWCNECGDAMCDRCSGIRHSSGSKRKKHVLMSCAEQRKGWQVVEGRATGTNDKPTDNNYYFHPGTGESSTKKPEELMIDDELLQHKLHMEARIKADEQEARYTYTHTYIYIYRHTHLRIPHCLPFQIDDMC
jgi:hypothetical protein